MAKEHRDALLKKLQISPDASDEVVEKTYGDRIAVLERRLKAGGRRIAPKIREDIRVLTAVYAPIAAEVAARRAIAFLDEGFPGRAEIEIERCREWMEKTPFDDRDTAGLLKDAELRLASAAATPPAEASAASGVSEVPQAGDGPESGGAGRDAEVESTEEAGPASPPAAHEALPTNRDETQAGFVRSPAEPEAPGAEAVTPTPQTPPPGARSPAASPGASVGSEPGTARLTVMTGPRKGEVIPLDTRRPAILGRLGRRPHTGPEQFIGFDDSAMKYMGRRQASISWDPARGAWVVTQVVRDDGRPVYNGSWLNATKLQPREQRVLTSGDQISLPAQQPVVLAFSWVDV